MEPKRLIVGVGLTALALAALLLFARKMPDRATPSVQLTSTANDGRPRNETWPAAITQSAAITPAKLPEPINYRRSWKKSRNDWELAHQLLSAAQAGDPDAQYYLSAVINYCEGAMNLYFTQRGERLTLAEGLAKAAKRSQEYNAQEAFDRCHQFQETDATAELGSAQDWLDSATRNGQPIAQATTADRMLTQDYLKNAIPVGSQNGMTIGISSGAPPDPQAVALLRAAVKSVEPEVLEIIGLEQNQLQTSRLARTVDEIAWIYVACQRGLNCSATSHWAVDCPDNCNVSTPESIIMAWSRDDWPAVQARANEINANIDAGRWDALRIGP